MGFINLNLSGNKLSTTGAMDLLNKLKKNFNGNIDLQNNLLDNTIMQQLYNIIDSLENIGTLDMRKNKIN